MRLSKLKGKFRFEYDKNTEVLSIYDKESGELDNKFKLDIESIEEVINTLKLHRDCSLELRSHKDTVIRSEKVTGLEVVIQSYQCKKGRVHQIIMKFPREGSSTKELFCSRFTSNRIDKKIKFFEDSIGGTN